MLNTTNVDLLLDLVQIQMSNLCLITIEDLGEFFQSGTAGLDHEEVHENKFAEDPDGVEERQVPVVWKVVPGDWVGVVSENQSSLNCQVHDHETLGTQLVWKNLERVGDEKSRPTDGVEDTEEPDPSNLWVASALNIASLLHANSRGEEEWSSSDTVNKEGGDDRDDKTEKCLFSIEWDLLILGCDAHAVVEKIGIVADDGVTGVLRNDTHGDEQHQSVPVTFCLHEVSIAAALLDLKFECGGFLDFPPFELDCCIVTIAVGVILGQNVQSLFVSFLGNEPTWGFWNPCNGIVSRCKNSGLRGLTEEENNLDQRWETLSESKKPP